jgi:hypothetical protein
VLESFGVQMIRLNRFNFGKDPVATIDGLMRERLEGMLHGRKPHDLVAEVAEKATKIEEGLRPLATKPAPVPTNVLCSSNR